VVLRIGPRKFIRAADLQETDYSHWEGHVVLAWWWFRTSVTGQRKLADNIWSRAAV
jgi:hypothetical protein